VSISLTKRKGYLPAVSALMTLTVFLAVTALSRNALLEPLDLKAYDTLRRTQRLDGSYSPHIVVIGIDEADIHSQLFHYPIFDSELADLLQKALDCDPRVIGVDIFRDLPVPFPENGKILPGRQKLLQLWVQNPNIVQVILLQSDVNGRNGVVVAKPPELDDNQVGFAEYGIDGDGVARRGLLFEGGQDPANPANIVTYSSFIWRITRWYLAGESPPLGPQPIPGADPKDFFLGKASLRHFHSDDGPYVRGDAKGVGFLLDCKSDGKILHLTGSQIITGNFPRDALKDAVVIVGMRADSVKDWITTPAAINQYGVDVHAATVDQLLRFAIKGDPQLRFFPKGAHTLWTLLWSVGGGLLGYFVRRPLLQVAGAFGGVTLLLLMGWLAFRWAWWVPVVAPGLSWVAAAALVGVHVSYRDRIDRLLLRQLFSNHASSRVVDELWAHREELLEEGRLKPRSLHATVMFTDLKGFATVAGNMTPEALIDWINGLMDPMSRLVYRHNGIIKQYAGDSIMALFGVPLAGPDGVKGDTRNAVCCALEMRRRLARINQRSRLKGQPEIEMRIGICTGPLVAGSIGGRARAEYTVIGDTVNLASRLESFEKSLLDADIAAKGCRILINEETNALLDARFQTRYVKTAALTGDRLVRIHGVIRGPASRPMAAASAPGSNTLEREGSNEIDMAISIDGVRDDRAGRGPGDREKADDASQQ